MAKSSPGMTTRRTDCWKQIRTSGGYQRDIDYDRFGRQQRVAEGSNIPAQNVQWHYREMAYDKMNRLVSQEIGKAGIYGTNSTKQNSLHLSYDGLGRPTQQVTDLNGENLVTELYYTAATPDGDKVNLRRVKDPNGNITSFDYHPVFGQDTGE